jgi:hypothetical protein
MAVHPGLAFPAGARRGPQTVARRRPTGRIRAQRRGGPVTVVLAGILTCFLLGLIYLTQTLQAAATVHEIEQLGHERRVLMREIQSLEGSIARWGAEPLVIERAGQLGLDRLGGKVHVPVR